MDPRRYAQSLFALAVPIMLMACSNLTNGEYPAEAPMPSSEAHVRHDSEKKGAYFIGPKSSDTAALLVHGFVGTTSNFNDLPQRLADAGVRVHVMLLPGHGTKPADLKEVSAQDLEDAVVAEAEALAQEHPKVYLAGHSMGASLCILAAARTPVDGLVLAAPYFRVTHHWYYGLRPETWTRILSPVVPWVYKGNAFVQVNDPKAKPHIASYSWIPAQAYDVLMKIGNRAAADSVLSKVSCPVLWLHAPEDQAASYAAAQQAVESMANARYTHVALERSNHHLFWDYDKETAMDAAVAFITGNNHDPGHAATIASEDAP